MIIRYDRHRSPGSAAVAAVLYVCCKKPEKSPLTRQGKPRKLTYVYSRSYVLPQAFKRRYGVQRSDYGKNVYIIDSYRPGPVIFYLHGGAYWQHPNKYHFRFIQKLVQKNGGKAVIPVYPKAPTYTCRDVYAMVGRTYEAVSKRHAGERVILMGDSAGGGLAMSFAMNLARDGKKVPQVVVMSPWLEITCSNPQMPFVTDPWLHPKTLGRQGRIYCGDIPVKDYRVSPIYGDTAVIRDLTVFTGTHEILYPDCLALEQKAPHVKMYIYRHMNHVFPLNPVGREARDAFKKIAAIIGDHRVENSI